MRSDYLAIHFPAKSDNCDDIVDAAGFAYGAMKKTKIKCKQETRQMNVKDYFNQRKETPYVLYYRGSGHSADREFITCNDFGYARRDYDILNAIIFYSKKEVLKYFVDHFDSVSNVFPERFFMAKLDDVGGKFLDLSTVESCVSHLIKMYKEGEYL